MNRSVAFGTFDGLHLGHMQVLESAICADCAPVAVTFDLPPRVFLQQEPARLLLMPQAKKRILRKMGFTVETLDFADIGKLPPTAFLNQIVRRFKPSLLVSGFNFRFGVNAAGDTALLDSYCRKKHIEYCMTQPVMAGNEIVSSTRIRQAVSAGQVALAEELLGRPFSYEGKILHGDARGRTIGFPTINQAYPDLLVLPRFGVYASKTLLNGRVYDSITNIGRRPTYQSGYIISETHIFEYDGDAYGSTAEIQLLDFVRDEEKFDSLSALQAAIERDKCRVRHGGGLDT